VPPEIVQRGDPHRLKYIEASDPYLEATWFGNVNLWISDGTESLLCEGWVSRYSKLHVIFRRIHPKPEALAEALQILETALAPQSIDTLRAVMVGHTHYDHVLDAPVWANLSEVNVGNYDISLLGTSNLVTIAKAYTGEHRVIPVEPQNKAKFKGRPHGVFETEQFIVRPIRINHSHSDDWLKKFLARKLDGHVSTKFKIPAHASAFKIDETLAFHVRHKPTGKRLLIYGSSGLPLTPLNEEDKADILYLCMANFADAGNEHKDDMLKQVIVSSGASVLIPVHWDDLFQDPGRSPRVMTKSDSDIAGAMEYILSHTGPNSDNDNIKVIWPQMWMPLKISNPNIGEAQND